MNLDRKTAIITGAARGIGKASAEKLARDGFNIVIIDLNQEAVAKVASEIEETYQVKALSYMGDVRDLHTITAIVADVVQKLGSVDVLVNNAGIAEDISDICETSDDDWKKIMDVNLMGSVNCVKAVLPLFKEQKSGRIINISSMAGQRGTMAVSFAYGASKAAIINLTKSLAMQLAKYNITVNSVSPGLIRSDMTAGFDKTHRDDVVPLGRMGTVEDVAGSVAFLAGDDASYITGFTIDVNGGFYLR